MTSTINRAIRDIEVGIVNWDKEKIDFILCFPYKGNRGKLLNSLKQTVKENGDINIQVTYTGKQLKSEVKVKVSTNFAQKIWFRSSLP